MHGPLTYQEHRVTLTASNARGRTRQRQLFCMAAFAIVELRRFRRRDGSVRWCPCSRGLSWQARSGLLAHPHPASLGSGTAGSGTPGSGSAGSGTAGMARTAGSATAGNGSASGGAGAIGGSSGIGGMASSGNGSRRLEQRRQPAGSAEPPEPQAIFGADSRIRRARAPVATSPR